MNSRSELEGWGTWQEDRRYLSRDRAHMIVVSKRTQRYGTEERSSGRTSGENSTSRNGRTEAHDQQRGGG
jgi:hypothetical protein